MEKERITWYDVLGVLPGAEPRKIKREYRAKSALLRPDMLAGAPPDVLTAVTRAQDLLDGAWEVLDDPVSRRRYDEAAGFRRSDRGLGQPGTGIESAGMTPADPGFVGELPGVAEAGAVGGLLAALTGGRVRKPRPARPVAVGRASGCPSQVSRAVSTSRVTASWLTTTTMPPL
jgi:curved DNA-binding protein CbpA